MNSDDFEKRDTLVEDMSQFETNENGEAILHDQICNLVSSNKQFLAEEFLKRQDMNHTLRSEVYRVIRNAIYSPLANRVLPVSDIFKSIDEFLKTESGKRVEEMILCEIYYQVKSEIKLQLMRGKQDEFDSYSGELDPSRDPRGETRLNPRDKIKEKLLEYLKVLQFMVVTGTTKADPVEFDPKVIERYEKLFSYPFKSKEKLTCALAFFVIEKDLTLSSILQYALGGKENLVRVCKEILNGPLYDELSRTYSLISEWKAKNKPESDSVSGVIEMSKLPEKKSEREATQRGLSPEAEPGSRQRRETQRGLSSKEKLEPGLRKRRKTELGLSPVKNMEPRKKNDTQRGIPIMRKFPEQSSVYSEREYKIPEVELPSIDLSGVDFSKKVEEEVSIDKPKTPSGIIGWVKKRAHAIILTASIGVVGASVGVTVDRLGCKDKKPTAAKVESEKPVEDAEVPTADAEVESEKLIEDAEVESEKPVEDAEVPTADAEVESEKLIEDAEVPTADAEVESEKLIEDAEVPTADAEVESEKLIEDAEVPTADAEVESETKRIVAPEEPPVEKLEIEKPENGVINIDPDSLQNMSPSSLSDMFSGKAVSVEDLPGGIVSRHMQANLLEGASRAERQAYRQYLRNLEKGWLIYMRSLEKKVERKLSDGLKVSEKDMAEYEWFKNTYSQTHRRRYNQAKWLHSRYEDLKDSNSENAKFYNSLFQKGREFMEGLHSLNPHIASVNNVESGQQVWFSRRNGENLQVLKTLHDWTKSMGRQVPEQVYVLAGEIELPLDKNVDSNGHNATVSESPVQIDSDYTRQIQSQGETFSQSSSGVVEVETNKAAVSGEIEFATRPTTASGEIQVDTNKAAVSGEIEVAVEPSRLKNDSIVSGEIEFETRPTTASGEIEVETRPTTASGEIGTRSLWGRFKNKAKKMFGLKSA